MSAESISIVGAGSPIFTTGIVRDLAYTPQLSGSELVLQDINEERLNAMTEVSKRLMVELGVDIRVRSTKNLESATTESRFVINTALAGGKETSDKEKKAISAATGLYGPVEAHASFRQLKLMREIATSIASKNPDATLIQAANPLPEGGTLIYRDTGIKFVGVCQGYKDMGRITQLLGMHQNEVSTKIAGINHDVWLTEFTYQNKDAYPILDDWIKNVSEEFYRHFLPRAKTFDYQLTPVAVSMYQNFGLWPVGDTVRAQTPEVWMYHSSPEVEEKWYGPTRGRESSNGADANNTWRYSVLQQVQEAAANKSGSVQDVFPGEPGGQIVPIIESISNDHPSIQQVNIPNHGAIAGLPDDFVVEVPAIVDGSGVRTEGTITLPSTVMFGAILPRWLQAERHVRAMQTGDASYLLQQYWANHKVPDMNTAEKILQIRKDQDPDMAKHFSNPKREGK